MDTGELIKGLVLNFGVMVTLIYLASAIARSFPHVDPRTRSVAMVGVAVVSGWITMVLAVKIGQLTFDLRWLPGVLVAFYARKPWVIALVFVLIGPARFYHGFNRPALYGFLVMVIVGVVMAAINPWLSRRRWDDRLTIACYVTVAVGLNAVWMLVQQTFLSVNFRGIHIGAIVPVQFFSTVALCFVAILIFKDLEEGRAERASLTEAAFKDPLTGLPNRRAFTAYYDGLKNRRGTPTSLAYVDIDHFKRINDQYGHASGDVVLTEVGTQIVRHVRDGDYCARLGGEEFVIALVDCSRDQAMEIAERVREAVERAEFTAVDSELRVTVSIGLTTSDRPEDSLVREADEAMYRAKSGGRNRVVHASDTHLRP